MDNAVIPLLAGLSVARTEIEEIPGAYDSDERMWMMETGQGRLPLIEVATGCAELATKTKVVFERDDPGAAGLAEIATKTFAVPERDDIGSSVLELATKTEVVRERDDR